MGGDYIKDFQGSIFAAALKRMSENNANPSQTLFDRIKEFREYAEEHLQTPGLFSNEIARMPNDFDFLTFILSKHSNQINDNLRNILNLFIEKEKLDKGLIKLDSIKDDDLKETLKRILDKDTIESKPHLESNIESTPTKQDSINPKETIESKTTQDSPKDYLQKTLNAKNKEDFDYNLVEYALKSSPDIEINTFSDIIKYVKDLSDDDILKIATNRFFDEDYSAVHYAVAARRNNMANAVYNKYVDSMQEYIKELQERFKKGENISKELNKIYKEHLELDKKYYPQKHFSKGFREQVKQAFNHNIKEENNKKELAEDAKATIESTIKNPVIKYMEHDYLTHIEKETATKILKNMQKELKKNGLKNIDKIENDMISFMETIKTTPRTIEWTRKQFANYKAFYKDSKHTDSIDYSLKQDAPRESITIDKKDAESFINNYLDSNTPTPLPKGINVEQFLKILNEVENKGDFIEHLKTRNNAEVRLAYLNLVEPTLKNADIELTFKGEGKKEYIKSFIDSENNQIYYLLVTRNNDKSFVTGIPKAKKGYIRNQVRNADIIRSFTPPSRSESIKTSNDNALSELQENLTKDSKILQDFTPNIKVDAQKLSLESLESIFKSGNKDSVNAELFDKAFKVAKDLNVTYSNEILGNKKILGQYNATTNKITLQDFSSETILHELIHSVTSRAIDNPQIALKPIQKHAINNLNRIYNRLKLDSKFKDEYALTNVKEMIAELSNPIFREKLKSRNLFQRMIDAIANFLGFRKDSSNYAAISKNLHNIIDNYAPNYTKTIESKLQDSNKIQAKDYIFAGEKALQQKGFNTQIKNLKTAKDLESKGESAESIWQKTGWYKDKDSKWKFEIDSSKGKLKGAFSKLKNKNYLTLQQILDDKELFKAYPQLKEIKVVGIQNQDIKGSYIPSFKQIEIDSDLSTYTAKSTLYHEIQHAIQDIESFAKGGNLYDFNGSHETKFDLYNKLHGEVEARNTQYRLEPNRFYNIKTNKITYPHPHKTMDVPLNETIIEYNNLLSANQHSKDSNNKNIESKPQDSMLESNSKNANFKDKKVSKDSKENNLKTYKTLEKYNTQDLKLLDSKEYQHFLDSVLSNDIARLKEAPNIAYIANLNDDLVKLLNLDSNKIYLRKNDLHHFRIQRKSGYNQDVESNILKDLPNLLSQAKHAYIDKIHNNFLITKELGNGKIAKFAINKDEQGNYIVTAGSVDKNNILYNKDLEAVGLAPTIPTQKRVPGATTLPPSTSKVSNDSKKSQTLQ
ncbi:hypothetical protein DCO58_05465 [Helicobacter saguini]|uniref:Large polyvalent protein associated domain-containing protein n=1 Tax=Helicobacter saguini TaxID=1548018 RepID=A0A347VT82_9HELI|nr:LPD23 domain-containing protein [Helicobacter saguini]MWV62202.1 hypothetical protein [Helicobacter saguini]MWV67125.1 hypothetical protein [Helicobacter saguini]MWV69475.1 hypothetical protein [Helicobacter saguini]MWV70972.1 hypothetical protein [Helicobacter saguini]TLD92942.1 hypothetical protein LS64_009645 [Helicobacter saguini]